MAEQDLREKQARAPVGPHRLSASRLFAIVAVFLVLATYAVWNSERFQTLFQGVSESRLSEVFQRPVSFRRVELRILPPSVRLADVRIGNDPRLGEPPFLTAEELSVSGGISLLGRELRLGRLRAVGAAISLTQFPDGSWNLPPGLSKPGRQGGLKVRVGDVVVQQGLLEFQGRKLKLEGRLQDFVAELESLSSERYRGSLSSRRATLRLPKSEPIVIELATRFLLEPKRGLIFEDLRLDGAFGQLRGSGAIESLAAPHALFTASGPVSIDEIERVFHSELGFSGRARVEARIEIPPGGPFRITGRIAAPRIDAHGFLLEDVAASVLARPEALLARIERARYAGGLATGTFRVEDLDGRQSPMTLGLEAEGLSLERFFADLDLPGTGLSGAAALTLALRWGKAGISRADGGGMLTVRPGPAASLVRGRFGVPTGGGGALTVVDGRIGFEGVTFAFPRSTLELTGGIRIGQWTPDFDYVLRSRDLAEVDRLFQNFVAASGGRPEPLGLGGTGEAQGHLAGRWADPEASFRLSAEEARYGGVRFGSVRGSGDVREGAFFLRPLRVYDGEASLSLEGMARYREAPGQPKFDLTVVANSYPLRRLLEYLELEYPVEGRLSGSFPIAGTPEALTGGGAVTLTDAVAWGQKLPQVAGRIAFAPGRFELGDVRAPLAGGMIGGSAAIAFREKSFEVDLAGDAVPVEAFTAIEIPRSDLSGRLSFELRGSGSLDRPNATLSASISEARFFGRPVPAGSEPRLEARLTEGVLEGSISVAGRWSVTASGDLFAERARLEVTLDARDLAALLLFTPASLPPGHGGALALHGTLALPARRGEMPTGRFIVTEARFDLPDRPGLLRASGEVRASLEGGRLAFEEFRAVGEGTEVKVRGGIELDSPQRLALSISGELDAALVSLLAPDVDLSGRLVLDLAASGSLSDPALEGTIRIENGKYRLEALALIIDDIDGSITLRGGGGEIDGLRARVGGGEAYAAGSFGIARGALRDFRVTVQARRISLRYPADMRLVVDADLVATGNGEDNVLRGEVVLLRGTYSRDFEVTLAGLLERGRPSEALAARQPWQERTSLEVHIVSAAALEVRNNLGRLTATVDLVARGTVADPSLVGQIVLDEGGRITFRDVRYEIESGTITFAGTTRIAPIIDLRARAEVKGYDLVINLVGTWPRIQTTLSSDPPLPDDAVIGLLLTGAEPSRRGGGPDATGSLVSAAGGIVAGAVAGGITRPTQRLFGLDRFRIDPIFSGSQLTDVRSTVGKQITPNLVVTYSQSLDSSREPVVQLEWQVTEKILAQALRDENGTYSINFRRRQRY